MLAVALDDHPRVFHTFIIASITYFQYQVIKKMTKQENDKKHIPTLSLSLKMLIILMSRVYTP